MTTVAAGPPDLQVLTPDLLPPAWQLLERVFGYPDHPDALEVEGAMVDPSRFYGLVEQGQVLACAGSFDLTMTVPGARLPVAGVTWISVSPTRRRRGVLSAMMRRQLEDLHDGGTSLAALWATEGAIYQRFGYGPGAWNLGMTVPSGVPFTRDVDPGEVELSAPDAARLSGLYDAVAATTPGWADRDEAWWTYRLHDPEHAREGGTPLQCVVTEGGYALYSAAGRYDDAGPDGEVRVRELVAADRHAHARLWRYLLDLDLMRTVRHRNAGADDPLLHALLATPRSALARLRESLWVRVVDVPSALAGRCYAAPVDVVLEVVDDRCGWNAGCWRLSGDRTGATCAPTGDAPDLRVSAADLGAAYLGGTPLRTRDVEQVRAGALDVVSTAFGPVGAAPSCPMVF